MLSLQRSLIKNTSISFFKRLSSSTVTATAKISSDSVDSTDIKVATTNEPKKERSSLVSAVFASLNDEKNEDSSRVESKKLISENKSKGEKPTLSEKLLKAETVNGLLSLTERNGALTRKDALKVISILSEWSSMNRVKISEFENDARFIKVCRILGRTVPKNEKNQQAGNIHNDFNMVLNIAGDDEAAKLIGSITVPQMVKVLMSLTQKKRRSTPLLRSLAYNISSSSEQLNLKQCGDILYSMASLNFLDSVLTAKVCADILAEISNHKEKSAVVGSILTSLGLLKYRDADVLESLFDWILKNSDNCRPQDIHSLFLTLGVLNYNVNNLEGLTKLVNSINEGDFSNKIDFLNYVWALTLLRIANDKHIEIVLSQKYIESLSNQNKELTPNAKMKLLNINAYAKHLLKDFKGPFLSSESNIYSVPLIHNKSKQTLLNGTLDALKSLFPSTTCIKSLVDSKMGFLIDAYCALDKKRNPIPLDKINNDAIKVAIMVIDFHDTCHGPNRSLTGLTKLCLDLLEENGYKVLPVLYSEFSISEKLLKRVQYLESNLKKIVKFNN